MKYQFIFSVILGIGVFIFCASMTNINHSQDPEWVVPDKYLNLENPVAADKNSLDAGKSLYNLHCKSCHGKEGLGDGPKAAQLETPSGDFTADSFIEQPDGALFYKTRVGRDDMPSFEKKIPYEEDIWHIVNYIRTFE